MAGNKLTAGKPGPGRPKGSRNKVTATAKAIIEGAAEQLGGQARLVAWAQEGPANERVFWGTLYPKLLPLQVQGDKENPLHVVSQIERRIVKAGD